jgi:hypothetical protein
MDPADLIPERRAKSWKREHEERCRRHQNNNDLKKCRDPGYGPDQSALLERKDNSTDLTKDAVRVENIEISSSDKLLNNCGDVDAENECASALRTTTEYASTNKTPTEGDVINNLGTVEGILSGGRSEIIFPLVQTAESLDVETESTFCKHCFEKEGRGNSTERNGVQMDFKGDSVMPEHICEGLSLCENIEESEKSHMILQQTESKMPEILPEDYSEISGRTGLGSLELQKVKSGPLEVSAELSELTVVKGTEFVNLEEAVTGREATTDMSPEIPEWVLTRPADGKPETSEDITPRFQDTVKAATVEGVSKGQSGFKNILQGHFGNISTVLEDDVNTEDSVQKADGLLGTEEFGKYGETNEFAGSDLLELGINNLSDITVLNNTNVEIIDTLVCSRDVELSNSSNFDLENRSGVPKDHLKGSLKTDVQKCNVHAEESNLSSFETPENVAEKLEEEETAGVKRGKNLFVELCHEENCARPAELADKIEHSVCLLDSTNSPSSFQAREQSASEFLEGPDTSGENSTFVSGCTFGNVAMDCKTTDKDSQTIKGTGVSKSENPVSELNDGNPRHLMDKPALEMTVGMFHKCVQLEGSSADSRYCVGIDSVQDQTSETAFLQPSVTASEDKVNILVLILSYYQLWSPLSLLSNG